MGLRMPELLGLVVAAGCSGSVPLETCLLDVDCRAGQRCASGQCVARPDGGAIAPDAGGASRDAAAAGPDAAAVGPDAGLALDAASPGPDAGAQDAQPADAADAQ